MRLPVLRSTQMCKRFKLWSRRGKRRRAHEAGTIRALHLAKIALLASCERPHSIVLADI